MANRDVATTAEPVPEGWYPDPLGRFEQRYFNGTTWTSSVTSGTIMAVDPVGAASYASPIPPVGSMYGQPGGYGPAIPGRTISRSRNAVGIGFPIGLLGAGLVLVGILVPSWIGSYTVIELLQSKAHGGSDASAVPELAWVVVAVGFNSVLAVVGTTLPYQPGRLWGFLAFGWLGLGLLWNRPGPHDPSRRANWLVAVMAPIWAAGVFVVFQGMTHALGDRDAGVTPLTLGPKLTIAGLLLVAIGALVGRRRIQAQLL